MYGHLHSHRCGVVESGLFHSASRSAHLSASVAGRGTIAKFGGSYDALAPLCSSCAIPVARSAGQIEATSLGDVHWHSAVMRWHAIRVAEPSGLHMLGRGCNR